MNNFRRSFRLDSPSLVKERESHFILFLSQINSSLKMSSKLHLVMAGMSYI